MSSTKPAIGAPIAMARTAAIRSFFVFIGAPERGTELGSKELRLFPGREVTALIDLVEINEIAVGAPGPCLRGAIDLLAETR